MNELQVGNTVYRSSSHYGLNKGVIDRVTKTRAFCGSQGFRRKYCDDGYLSVFPRESGWNRDSYLIGTKELDADYLKQRYVKKVSDIKWEEHNIETLMEVIQITGEEL